jgi:hypothetical protein
MTEGYVSINANGAVLLIYGRYASKGYKRNVSCQWHLWEKLLQDEDRERRNDCMIYCGNGTMLCIVLYSLIDST